MNVNDPREELDRIAAPFMAGYELNATYPSGIPAIRMEPVSLGIDGYLGANHPDARVCTTARELRAWLLSQAEDLIGTLAAQGWFLESMPSLDFGGWLMHAGVFVNGTVYQPPKEMGISLRLRLSLVRLKPCVPLPEGVPLTKDVLRDHIEAMGGTFGPAEGSP